MKKLCSIDDCSRQIVARGMCRPHYDRSRDGRPMDAPIRSHDPGRTCSIEGCDEPYKANEYCARHNTRSRRGNSMTTPLRSNLDRCEWTLEGEPCDQKHYGRGMCRIHWERSADDGDMDAPIRQWIPDRLCSSTVEGEPCGRPMDAHDLCSMHNRRQASGFDMDGPLMRHCGDPDAVVTIKFSGIDLVARLSMFSRCYLCGEDLEGRPIHKDHIKPKHAGGYHMLGNLRPTHRSCNSSKSAAWPIDTSTASTRRDPARLP